MKLMQDIRIIQAKRTEPRKNTAMTLLSAVCKVMSSQLSQYNLSVESNQNVESKRQSVESKMGKRGA